MSFILLFLICFHSYGAGSLEQSRGKILAKISRVFDQQEDLHQKKIKDMSYDELKRFPQLVNTVNDVSDADFWDVQKFLDNHRDFLSKVSRLETEKENIPPLNKEIFDFHKREALRYLLLSAQYLSNENRSLYNVADYEFCEQRRYCYASAMP
ncbi:MAG: hypothetical protein OXC30_01290 [Alphaproteobacteria bacterium]|nr:hypothetical protein [Alphaproteobacteria bacterium]